MPSLYEATANTGEVSSSNFTTLYNASGLLVPNAGTGSVTGNLNVGGNLTVQGTSLLIGEVTLQSTLSLPNYTFPLPDGTTDQVLVTDGNGNLYWTDVSAIPGADYNISATTATGGANLTLANTAGFSDSVKFASGTNINVVRTDANTITISTTADDIPDGTAQGQVLYWNGSAWTANSTITSLTTADRLTAVLKNTSTALGSSFYGIRDFGSVPYATGYASTIGFGVDSDSQATARFGAVGFTYSATDPSFIISSSTDNFSSLLSLANINGTDASFDANNLVLKKNLTGTPTENCSITVNRGSSTDATLTWNETTDTWDFNNSVVTSGDLAVNGGDITTTATTASVFNTTATTVNIAGAGTAVAIGANSGTLTLRNPTVVGTQTTQNLYNTTATTVNAFGAATAVNIGASTGTTTVAHDLTVNGGNINLNGLASAGNYPFLTFEPQNSGVNPLYGIRGKSTVNDPWFFGAGSTGVDTGYVEIASGDNADVLNGASPVYVRQYSGSGIGGAPWYGGSGTIVNSLTILDENGNTVIPKNLTVDSGTLFVDATNNRVGINTLTPGYTLDVNGDANVSGDIYVSGVHVDLSTPVHQGQLLYVSNDVTPTITNSSTIIAANASYRPVFQYDNSTAGINAAMFVKKNYGAGTYTTDDGVQIGFQLDSNSQPITQLANIGVSYDATAPEVFLSTNANNNTTGPFINAAAFSSTTAKINGTTLLLDYNNSGAGNNITIAANRGSSGADATLVWDESLDLWTFNNDVYSSGTIIGGVALATNGNNIYFNNEDGTAADCFITVKRPAAGDPQIKWNESTDRWQTSVDGTTYLNIPNQNLDTTSDVSFAGVSVDGITTFNTQTTTTTATTTVQISGTTRASQKAVIRIEDNISGEIHMLEALAFYKGTTAYLTTYAEMYSNAALATFTASISGGTLSILATPASTNSTTFTVARISLD